MVRQEGRARGVGKGITQERDWYREREREIHISIKVYKYGKASIRITAPFQLKDPVVRPVGRYIYI